MNSENDLKKFKEFISSEEIMIVDRSSASRRRLVKTLVDMGADRGKIHSVAHLTEALEIVNTSLPKLILSDYTIKGGSGFDLFKEYRLRHPQEKKAVLILITSNISQSAVAKAAEEDVDSFIIKPYTMQSLDKSLVSAVINKLYPSEYIQTIDAGKEKLVANEYEEALKLFEKAKGLNKKPSLAIFYYAQTKDLLNIKDEAEQGYKDGLKVNKIHYKCQVGLYKLFMDKKDYPNAYAVVKNIAKYFPANPDRLKEVIRLAITTKNYEDMEYYYNLYIELDERDEQVTNYMCSGLYVTGKYYFLEHKLDEGKKYFEKSAVSCAGKAKFLFAMVKVYIENNLYPEAEKLLPRFGKAKSDVKYYMISFYLAKHKKFSLDECISKGTDLWNKGYKDPQAVKILIKALSDGGHEDKAKQYKEDASYEWPEEFSPSKEQAA